MVIEPQTPPDLWRADRAVQHLTSASRRQTNGLFDSGCVTLNGAPCAEPWKHLAVGDRIEVDFDPERRYKARPKPPKYLGFWIGYEDEHLLVVDKPAAWLTVPTEHGERDTLVQRIEEYVSRQNRGRPARLSASHRLDRGVSGLLVFGKTPSICAALRRQFAARTPERRYVALVAGRVEAEQGEMRSYLTTDERLTRHSTDDPDEGELAITRFATVERLEDSTLVRVELETGRRNQIRVHWAEAGHPILGDPRYGKPGVRHPRWPHLRLALHAELLAFEHPANGRRMLFERPMPVEFTEFLAGRSGVAAKPDDDATAIEPGGFHADS